VGRQNIPSAGAGFRGAGTPDRGHGIEEDLSGAYDSTTRVTVLARCMRSL